MAWGNTCNVDTGVQTSSSILFAKNGQKSIRQVETVETTETRGMTVTAGKDQGKVIDDQTTQTTYWSNIDGEIHSIDVTTGTKTEWSSARKDESGQWVATKRVTTYSVIPATLPDIWGTKKLDANGNEEQPPSEAGAGETVVSFDRSTSHIVTFDGKSLVSTISTEISEITKISTEAAAKAIVNAWQATPETKYVHTPYSVDDPDNEGAVIPCSWAARDVTVGTEKYASAKFVSSAEGWTVTKTKKVYDYIRNRGWSE